MTRASEARFYREMANGDTILKKKFAEYLRQAGIGDMVLTLAKKGEHYANFYIPIEFESIAESYLRDDLGYDVTMYEDGNVREGWCLVAQIRW